MISIFIDGGLLGLTSALFSIMLFSWMYDGMIFQFWGDFVDWLNEKGYSWLAKPLGYCIYCFSQWVLIGLFCVFILKGLKIPNEIPDLILLFVVSSGVNFYIIKKNEKIL